MRQARAGDSRAFEERDRRARLDEIRANEREARGGGRGRGRGRGRGGSRFDNDRGDRPRDSGWGARGGVRADCSVFPPCVDLRTATRWSSSFSPTSLAAASASFSRSPQFPLPLSFSHSSQIPFSPAWGPVHISHPTPQIPCTSSPGFTSPSLSFAVSVTAPEPSSAALALHLSCAVTRSSCTGLS